MPKPHSYDIDLEHRHVWIRAEGLCALADALATLEVIDRDQRAGPGFALLFDLRSCREDLQLFEVEELAGALARSARTHGGAVAFLASRTSAFGVAHMLASFARIEGIRAAAFQDLARAVAWIDEVRG
jgi:hypothetical protein